ncbi:hypothetical protein BH10ACT1_BH10ACT1_02200 [soil metagenome]
MPGEPLYPPAPDGGWGPAGPPPVAPEFPFAEARAALQALDALSDDIGHFGFQHALLTSSLDGTFHGSAKTDFDDRLVTARGQLAPEATALLESDRAWLLQAIADAGARQDQYVVDLAAWRHRQQLAAAVPA